MYAYLQENKDEVTSKMTLLAEVEDSEQEVLDKENRYGLSLKCK